MRVQSVLLKTEKTEAAPSVMGMGVMGIKGCLSRFSVVSVSLMALMVGVAHAGQEAQNIGYQQIIDANSAAYANAPPANAPVIDKPGNDAVQPVVIAPPASVNVQVQPQPAPQQMLSRQVAPQQPVQAQVDLPAVTSQNNPQPLVIQGEGALPAYDPNRVYSAPQPQPSYPPPVQNVAIPSVSVVTDAPVEGFADKVPLTIALQQILPQGYGYTLGDGVDPGLLVSWRGGRVWNQVLQDMVANAGLMANINGRNIVVAYAGGAAAMVPPPPMVRKRQANQQETLPPYVPQQPYAVNQDQPPVLLVPDNQPAPPPATVVVNQPAANSPPPQEQARAVPQHVIPKPQPLRIENPAIFVSQHWEAKPGQNLRALLREWCARVGAELNWNAEYDYPIMASVNITGTFEEAVRTLLSGFGSANPTPRGQLHYNPAVGQTMLIVEATGNNYGE